MAEGEKIGANAIANMIEAGRVEAAQFNEGQRAMEAPPVEAPESSFAAAIQQQRDMVQPQQDREMEMER